MFEYQAYGFNISSDIKLWPLSEGAHKSDFSPLSIRAGEVPERGIEGGELGLLYCHALDNKVWLRIPGIVRFLISGDKEICYQSEAPANAKENKAGKQLSDRELSIFIQSHAVAYACMMRGDLVLRASALSYQGQTVVLLGNASAGKSSIAAGLAQQGITILSDEFCAIDPAGKVRQGYSYIKIWRDMFGFLNLGDSGLEPVRQALEKYIMPIEPVPNIVETTISHIIEINASGNKALEYVSVKGLEKINFLNGHHYRAAVRAKLQIPDRQAQSIELALQAKFIRMNRPLKSSALKLQLESLIAQIEAR